MPKLALAPVELKQHAPPHFEYIEIDLIRIDSYQRDLEQEFVAEMVREYDVDMMQPVDLSHRADGTFWCFEGQHRVEAARNLGHTVIAAMVHEGLTFVQEALLFAKLQKKRRNLSAWDSYRARLIGRDPVALMIQGVCDDLHLKLGRRNADISAVSALARVHRFGGVDLLHLTLSNITRIWPLANRRFDGAMIVGVAVLFQRFGHEPLLDPERLVSVLSLVPPSAILQEARVESGGTMPVGGPGINYAVARVLRNLYNKRLSAKRQLPMFLSAAGRRLPGEA